MRVAHGSRARIALGRVVHSARLARCRLARRGLRVGNPSLDTPLEESLLMRVSIRAVIAGLALVPLLAQARADELPAYPDHAHLLTYVDDAGAQHPVSTPEDWAKRRRHI